jgi:hypothetical protein
MAICDYCGASYRGGAMKEGPYRFCTGLCRDRGMKILQNLEGMSDEQMETLISRAHQGPCPICNRNVTFIRRIAFGPPWSSGRGGKGRSSLVLIARTKSKMTISNPPSSPDGGRRKEF